MIIQSGHNFVHVTTAELSWHVQSCGLCGSWKSLLQQREYLQGFACNLIENRSLCVSRNRPIMIFHKISISFHFKTFLLELIKSMLIVLFFSRSRSSLAFSVPARPWRRSWILLEWLATPGSWTSSQSWRQSSRTSTLQRSSAPRLSMPSGRSLLLLPERWAPWRIPINYLKPWWNGGHFADDILKCFSLHHILLTFMMFCKLIWINFLPSFIFVHHHPLWTGFGLDFTMLFCNFVLIYFSFFPINQVQSLLLPLYLKPTVPHRIRAAAFLMIMKTTPSTGIMQYMTHGLKKETSMEMVSFVYTYLKAISLSEDPLMFNMYVPRHYNDLTMSVDAHIISGISIVCSIACSG